MIESESRSELKKYEITDREWKFLTGEFSYDDLTSDDIRHCVRHKRNVMAPVLLETLSKKRKDPLTDELIWALGELRYKDALNLLVALLKQTDSNTIREKIISALGQLDDQGAVPYLVQVLKNPRIPPALKMEAALAIKSLGREEEIRDFLAQLKKSP